ncbi:hypothetical protein HYV69_00970 [Candidatus Uhrbacteria bacterium]|nr:hypothetical protein [Candidatus Uhrbacteria bacterium]
MGIKRVRTREPRPLSSEQKVAFVLLLFLGLGGIFFGFRSFGVNIKRPFDLQIAKYLQGERFVSTSQREQEELEASKTRDVDGDGLTDYDELQVYKTSPYLADSDSDGFDDKMEIFSNNDPNCPKDKICTGISSAEIVDESNPLAGLEGIFGDMTSLSDAGEINFKSKEDVEAFFKKATLVEIRKALLKSGMKKEDLDKLDDKSLSEFFNMTVDEASKKGTFDALVSPTEVTE